MKIHISELSAKYEYAKEKQLTARAKKHTTFMCMRFSTNAFSIRVKASGNVQVI